MNDTPTSHPPTEQLTALVLGLLDEAEAAMLGSHVWDCPVCLQALDQIAEKPDPFLFKLRDVQGEARVSPAPLPALGVATGSQQTTGQAAPDGWPSVPGYEVLQELGQGGMGVVYKARQVKLNRLVALKMIRGSGLPDAEERLRFKVEAEAVARLQHPNIVQIYEVGEADGRPYFALELVEGGSLAQQIDGQPLPAREAASQVQALAEAMQLAHSRNLVHRDLKPANVLLASAACGLAGSSEEAPAKPQAAHMVPKITDFGLARQLDRDSGLTETGMLVGTPSYMSPEQASGRRQDVGPAADVYALGAILYECLTGQPPFKGTTVLETLDQVRHQEPVPPGRLQPKVPRDLDTICLKCLQKQPERRYASASALADDLRRFLGGEPITARPVGRVERTVKWVRRNPVVAALLALVLLALAGGTTGIYLKYRDAEEQKTIVTSQAAALQTALGERDDALGKATSQQKQAERLAGERGQALAALKTEKDEVQKQKEEVEKERDRATFVAYAFRLREAQAAIEHGRVEEAETILQSILWTYEKLRGWEYEYLLRQTQKLQLLCRGHSGNVVAVCFSPDGKRMASASDDKTVRLWDAQSGKRIHALQGHTNGTTSVSFSPDGLLLASGSQDQTAKVWDVQASKEVRTLRGHTGPVQSVSFSPDGKWIASASADQTVKVWDAQTGKEALTLRGHTAGVTSVSFGPDGKQLVSASADQTLRLWDVATGKEVYTLRGHTASVNSVSWSREGRRIASGSLDRTVRVWDAQRGVEVATFKGHQRGVNCVCFNADGTRIASGGAVVPNRGEVKVWDVQTGQEALSLTEGINDALCVSFSPDGQRLAVGDRNEFIYVLDARTGLLALVVKGRSNISSVRFSPDGNRLVLAGGAAESTVQVVDSRTGEQILALQGHTESINSACFSPDGKRIVSTSHDNTVRVWDATGPKGRGKELLTLAGHWGFVYSAGFSPDGKLIVSGGQDSTVKVWDAQTGANIRSIWGHGEAVTCVCFSPDGKQIASGSADHTVKLWDVQTGRRTLYLRGHAAMIHSVCFSADGRRLASGSQDNTVKVWDVQTGKELLVLQGHSGGVISVAFSPDGKRLVTASDDKTVRLWDTQTGQEAFTLKGHTEPVRSVSFSPDGKRIVSGGWDYTVRVWDARLAPQVRVEP